MYRRRATVGTFALAAALIFALPTAASADEGDDEINSPAEAVASAQASGITDPLILGFVEEVTQGADEIAMVTYEMHPVDGPTPTTEDTGSFDVTAAPSCAVVTIISHKKGTGGAASQIHGDTLVSCNASFVAGSVNDTMTHYNPDWGVWDSTVDIARKSGQVGTSMTNHTQYTCVNSNASNYRVASAGTVRIGTQTVGGGGADYFDNLVSCGT